MSPVLFTEFVFLSPQPVFAEHCNAEKRLRHRIRVPDMPHARHGAGVFLAFLVPRLGCFENAFLDSSTMSAVLDI